jgi:hypothetical protein
VIRCARVDRLGLLAKPDSCAFFIEENTPTDALRIVAGEAQLRHHQGRLFIIVLAALLDKVRASSLLFLRQSHAQWPSLQQ